MNTQQSHEPEIRLLPPERMLYRCDGPDCGEEACWETSYQTGENGRPEGLVVKYACDGHAETFGKIWGVEFPPHDATWSSCCSVLTEVDG
jgi:hypothetical protein